MYDIGVVEMSIDSRMYVEIDNICKVLFIKELDIDPTDKSMVLRSYDDIGINDARQMIFWNKLYRHIHRVDISNPICYQLAIMSFISNNRTGLLNTIYSRDNMLQELCSVYIKDNNLCDNILNKKCSYCKMLPPNGIVYRCSKCNMVYYCSKGCQTRDWVVHKSICTLLPKYFVDLYS